MWLRMFSNVIFTVCVLHLAQSKPFLYNAPSALATLASSASASASSRSEPLTNIADLRRKQQKAEALQQDKQLVEEDAVDSVLLEGPEDDTNEAAPSILQKKINKILTKIRIISSLSSAIGGGSSSEKTDNTTGGNDDFTEELEDFDRKFENDEINNKADDNAERASTIQKVIYPHFNSAAPVKVSLDINPRIVNQRQSQTTEGYDDFNDDFDDMDETMGRLGQIGVFFAELLGSVVGLVYGAAAQINNIAQGTTKTSII